MASRLKSFITKSSQGKSFSTIRGATKERMKHHLMIGTWTPPGAIFTVAFDDEALTLELVKRTEIPEDQPISWMTFDVSKLQTYARFDFDQPRTTNNVKHARKNIYGAGMKKWGSYAVNAPTDIKHQTSLVMGGHPRANDADTKTRAIFVLAAQKPPYNVYGNPFYDHAGFLNVFDVDESGSLRENVQNAELDERSAIHGMVFDAAEEYLYSADMWANKIWCHRKDAQNGLLTLVGHVAAPAANDHPRWVEIAPSGKYLYALMEAGNRLCVYAIDEQTRLPVYTEKSYPLIPPDFGTFHPRMYRSDVTFRTVSGKYLFATARSNSDRLTGYISAFALDESGQIIRQICMNPTPTSGGHSNAVSPCPWTDEWLALCDDEKGFVEIYRWKDEFLGRVAHLDIKEPGFGMNAIWYD